MLASGIWPYAIATLLVHESTSHGNLVVHVGCLRDGIFDNMDGGEILAVRMGRSAALSKLQVPYGGRLLSNGANLRLARNNPCGKYAQFLNIS